MRCKTKIVFFLVFLISAYVGISQDTESTLKSGSYQNQPISEILDQLADLYQVSIYYKADNQLTRSSTMTFDARPLDDVLVDLLSETTLGHIDYRGYAKIIAPKLLIEQSYSSDYYQALEGSLSDDGDIQKKREVEEIYKMESPSLGLLSW